MKAAHPHDSGCAATALRKASRRISQFYDSALAPSGLRSTQYAILAALHKRASDPPTLQELADVLVMDRSALGHTLRPLEREGLVAFQQGEFDRRLRHVVLMKPGAQAYLAARPMWASAQRRFHDLFGAEEANVLRYTLLDIAHGERFASLAAEQ